jgi:PAS domain S-box-containing protein
MDERHSAKRDDAIPGDGILGLDWNIVEKILELGPIGIIVQDAAGRDILANSRAENILGIERREIATRRYDSHEWDATDRRGIAISKDNLVAEQVRRTGKPVYGVEIGVRRSDGSRTMLEVNASPLLDESGSYNGLVYTFEDITERVRMEEELREYHQHLEEMVEERTKELRETSLKLQEEVQMRTRTEKELLENSRKLRALSQHIEMIREQERTRVSAQIQEALGQTIAVLKMNLKKIEKNIPQEAREEVDLGRVYETLNSFIKQTQSLSESMRPPILDLDGLSAAIEWQAERLQETTGIECSFTRKAGEMVILSKALSTSVFRIFQEALENAALHSGATRIGISLAIDTDALELRVADNGKGISDEEIEATSSLGLFWMKERAQQFSGTVELSTGQGRGTEILLRVPMGNV